MYGVIQLSLNVVFIPTNERAEPDKKNNADGTDWNNINIPTEKQNNVNKNFCLPFNKYQESEIEGIGPLNLIIKNDTYDIKIIACAIVSAIVLLLYIYI